MKMEVERSEGKDDNGDKIRSEDECGYSSKGKGQTVRYIDGIEDNRNENRRQIKDTES